MRRGENVRCGFVGLVKCIAACSEAYGNLGKRETKGRDVGSRFLMVLLKSHKTWTLSCKRAWRHHGLENEKHAVGFRNRGKLLFH